MRAWLKLSVPEFFALGAEDVAARLAYAQAGRHGTLELTQRNAWVAMAEGLRVALAMAEAADWTLLLEYDLLRLEKRIDAILLTDRATLVLEWKDRAPRFAAADLRQVEDYALDLHDFHAGCRAHPVVPLLVATDAPETRLAPPLIWQGVPPPLAVNVRQLGERLREILASIGPPPEPMRSESWLAAPYRPVPGVLEAASMLFDRHRSAEMVEARADATNLTRTTGAVLRAIEEARAKSERIVIFVTGIPGAGKTLCGLNIVFGALRESGAAFLTGNAPLVAVLREDLRRRSGDRKGQARTALQNVHRFLEHHVLKPDETPEARIIVFDEAQRAWDQTQATRDTQRRVSRLTLSEPAHMLDILARHQGWCALVALIGQGQEINTGEAGLGEWARVIAERPEWRAVAAPGRIAAPRLRTDEALDLTVPMRSVRHGHGARWVDALLRGEAAEAAEIARDGVPFYVTRDLAEMRTALRGFARGERRAGLVASSGAKRLRAEGLGHQLPDVENWFLDRWPDVRGSDALETTATEYDCQGLELDVVGLCWGGDLLRGPHGWLVQRFGGSRWTTVHKPETHGFFVNKYRVLLTRARYETVIWIPRGSDPAEPFFDRTRPRAAFDALADYLRHCGAGGLPSKATAQSVEPQLNYS